MWCDCERHPLGDGASVTATATDEVEDSLNKMNAISNKLWAQHLQSLWVTKYSFSRCSMCASSIATRSLCYLWLLALMLVSLPWWVYVAGGFAQDPVALEMPSRRYGVSEAPVNNSLVG